MKESPFFRKAGKDALCQMCPHFCLVKEGSVGRCGTRRNIGGRLCPIFYGKPCSIAVDPVEKKPFFHFAPASLALSVATAGCNFSCRHCQNWEISQSARSGKADSWQDVPPASLMSLAKRSGVQGMAWTYTEPTVFFEYFYDTASLDSKKILYQAWVSNGFTSIDVIRKASELLDAANIDYKGDDGFYKEVCGARLQPVLDAMKEYRRLGVWLEITNLLIPGHNDGRDDVLQMVSWIRENLGRDVPLHFSAYHPDFMMKAPPTGTAALEKAISIADDYLDYVYAGNVLHDRESTFCPRCKEMLIRRSGFAVSCISLEKKGSSFFCGSCGRKIPIAGARWMGHTIRLSRKKKTHS